MGPPGVFSVKDISMCFPLFLLLALLIAALYAQGRSPLGFFDITSPRRTLFRTPGFRGVSKESKSSGTQRGLLGALVGGAYSSLYLAANKNKATQGIAKRMMRHAYVVDPTHSFAPTRVILQGADKGKWQILSEGKWEMLKQKGANGTERAKVTGGAALERLQNDAFANRLSNLEYARGGGVKRQDNLGRDLAPMRVTKVGNVRMMVTGIQGTGGGAVGKETRIKYGAVGGVEKSGMWLSNNLTALRLAGRGVVGMALVQAMMLGSPMREARASEPGKKEEIFRKAQRDLGEKTLSYKGRYGLLAQLNPLNGLGAAVAISREYSAKYVADTEAGKRKLKDTRNLYNIFSPNKTVVGSPHQRMTNDERSRLLIALDQEIARSRMDAHHLATFASTNLFKNALMSTGFVFAGMSVIPGMLYSTSRSSVDMYIAARHDPLKKETLAYNAITYLATQIEPRREEAAQLTNTVREARGRIESADKEMNLRGSALRELNALGPGVDARAVERRLAAHRAELARLEPATGIGPEAIGRREGIAVSIASLQLIRAYVAQEERRGRPGQPVEERVRSRLERESDKLNSEKNAFIEQGSVGNQRLRELDRELDGFQRLHDDALRQMLIAGEELRRKHAGEGRPRTLSAALMNLPGATHASVLKDIGVGMWNFEKNFVIGTAATTFIGPALGIHSFSRVSTEREAARGKMQQARDNAMQKLSAADESLDKLKNDLESVEHSRAVGSLSLPQRDAYVRLVHEAGMVAGIAPGRVTNPASRAGYGTSQFTQESDESTAAVPLAEFSQHVASARHDLASLRKSAPADEHFRAALDTLDASLFAHERAAAAKSVSDDLLAKRVSEFNKWDLKGQIDYKSKRYAELTVENLNRDLKGIAQEAGKMRVIGLNAGTQEGVRAAANEEYRNFERLYRDKERERDDALTIFDTSYLIGRVNGDIQRHSLALRNAQTEWERQREYAILAGLDAQRSRANRLLEEDIDRGPPGVIAKAIGDEFVKREYNYQKALNSLKSPYSQVLFIGAQVERQKEFIPRISRGAAGKFDTLMQGFLAKYGQEYEEHDRASNIFQPRANRPSSNNLGSHEDEEE